MRLYNITCALLVCAAVALAPGCEKGSDKKNAEYAKLTNPLWALAPTGTAFGLVIGDGTGTQLHKALLTIARTIETRQGGPEIMRKLRSEMAGEVPVDLFDAKSFAQYGVDLARGAAIFVTRDKRVTVILPISNRQAFVNAVKGTTENGVDRVGKEKGRCKEVAGRYACAESEEDIALLGKSDEMQKRMASQTRGHIEVWADLAALGVDDRKLTEYFTEPGVASGALQLEPGGFTVRGQLATKPKNDKIKALSDAPRELAQAAAKDKPPGIFRLSLPIFGTLVPIDEAVKELAPIGIIGGIDIKKDLIENFTGEVIAYSPAGQAAELVIKVGVRDGSKLDPLIKGFCNLGAEKAPELGLAVDGKRCTAKLDPDTMKRLFPGDEPMPFNGPVTASIQTEDRAVVASIRPAESGKSGSVEYDDLAREFATGAWNLALWGKGLGVSPDTAKTLAEFKDIPEAYSIMTAIMWAAAHLSETGLAVGVREDGIHAVMHIGTQFANPDDVLAEFQKILDRLLAGDPNAMADLEKLAKKSPNTPFGRSMAAGHGGLSGLAGSATGMASAIAAPAFLRYKQRSQEAGQVLPDIDESVPEDAVIEADDSKE